MFIFYRTWNVRYPAYLIGGGKGSSVKLSVAICTYNGEEFVGEQLRSILEQTKKVDEIIVSDDGSSDATLDRVGEAFAHFSGHAPQWRILKGERLGIVRNFSRAVSACTGDIIFLCDQDDVWHPQKVEKIVSNFESQPDALLVCSDARLVDANLRDLGKSQFQMARMTKGLRQSLEGTNGFETLLRRNVVTGATVAFRRELLDIALPFVDGWLHDEWLAILAAARGGLRVIDTPLVLYRQHGANQCGMRPEPLTSQVAHATGRTREPSGCKRIQHLIDRIGNSMNPSDRTMKHLRSALAFEQKRKQLASARMVRIVTIGFMAITGKYWRYADGMRSVAKDILAA